MKPILFSTEMVKAILAGNKTTTRRIVKMPKDNIREAEWGFTAFTPPGHISFRATHESGNYGESFVKMKYCKGNILWVREAWRIVSWNWDDGQMLVEYKDGAKEWVFYPDVEEDSSWMIKQFENLVDKGYFIPDAKDKEGPFLRTEKLLPWRPSIFMPKEACRLFLKITDIRVERLQDITEDDAKAEGVQPNCDNPAKCPSPYCEKNGCQGSGQYIHYLRNLDDFPADSARESFESLWHKINGRESWEANPWAWVITFERTQKPS